MARCGLWAAYRLLRAGCMQSICAATAAATDAADADQLGHKLQPNCWTILIPGPGTYSPVILSIGQPLRRYNRTAQGHKFGTEVDHAGRKPTGIRPQDCQCATTCYLHAPCETQRKIQFAAPCNRPIRSSDAVLQGPLCRKLPLPDIMTSDSSSDSPRSVLWSG